MSPRLALSIGAVVALLTGIPFVLAPAQALELAGITTPPDFALVPARDTGTVLIGVGIIDWLARDAVGAPLRGLLWGNIFIRVGAVVVNGWEFATGQLPGVSTTTVAVLAAFSIALVVVFLLALRRA
jgi:uncharacterized protein YjeT (DUF2065 family)